MVTPRCGDAWAAVARLLMPCAVGLPAFGRQAAQAFTSERASPCARRSSSYNFEGYQEAMAAQEEELAAAAQQEQQAASTDPLDQPTSKVPLVPITKITEKYERDPAAKGSDHDLARRVFLLESEVIKLVFHFGENRVSAATKSFKKDGSCLVVQVGATCPLQGLLYLHRFLILR